jgi:hypothetical protein
MTREDIIKLAREAGLGTYLEPQWDLYEELKCFAALVATAERELCAMVCEAEWSNVAERMYGQECATAIRARGQP